MALPISSSPSVATSTKLSTLAPATKPTTAAVNSIPTANNVPVTKSNAPAVDLFADDTFDAGVKGGPGGSGNAGQVGGGDRL